MDRRRAVTLIALAVAAGACSRGPRALVSGEDACAFCRMTIDDVRFGALVLTARGKLQTFDSIECLASYLAALPTAEQPRGAWVANFEHPAQWLDAQRATYLQGSQVKSPMGRELAAFAGEADVSDLTKRYGGRVVAWPDVVTQVVNRPSRVGSNRAHTH